MNTTYSVLSSWAGWVLQDCPSYAEAEECFSYYVGAYPDEQASLWSSDDLDPLLTYDPPPTCDPQEE